MLISGTPFVPFVTERSFCLRDVMEFFAQSIKSAVYAA
jgi:hypothetical protein